MPTTCVEPCLIFSGRCEEAIEFYKTAVGARVEFLMRYQDSPGPLPPDMVPPGFENKILHATFHIGETRLLAADSPKADQGFAGFCLLLALPSPAEAECAFAALAAGGQVVLPLGKTFWSPCYGVLKDRFGLSWKITLGAG